MKKDVKNFPASISTRLKQRAQRTGRPFIEVFYNYVIERFLYRLSKSEYRESLIVKGGLAFWGWGINLRRSTRDIDFQSSVDNSNDDILAIIRAVCVTSTELEDGIVFDAGSAQAETIMIGTEHEGVRVRFKAYLGKAYLWLQVDVSYANVITPNEVTLEYRPILEMPVFNLLGYSRETAIAEKFQAMVMLGAINDRLKDYFDIYLLASECNFGGKDIVRAIIATFSNRATEIPRELPIALSDEFGRQKNADWLRFLKRMSYEGEDISNFLAILEALRTFLLPSMQAAAKGEDFSKKWLAGGKWTE